MDNMIFKRTSVRSFTNEKIKPEQIELLLKAAMAAPTGCNAQPWEFIVIQDKEKMGEIMKIHPFSMMLKEAPLVIMVCADITKAPCKVPDMVLWPQDCSAATQNIMLQATEMGLGSVWLGVHPRVELQTPLANMFKLPENVLPFSLVPVGYPTQEQKPREKFDKEKIHYEKW